MAVRNAKEVALVTAPSQGHEPAPAARYSRLRRGARAVSRRAAILGSAALMALGAAGCGQQQASFALLQAESAVQSGTGDQVTASYYVKAMEVQGVAQSELMEIASAAVSAYRSNNMARCDIWFSRSSSIEAMPVQEKTMECREQDAATAINARIFRTGTNIQDTLDRELPSSEMQTLSGHSSFTGLVEKYAPFAPLAFAALVLAFGFMTGEHRKPM